MISIKTAALIMTMSVLGAVTPAAFAQNTSVNTDDDVVLQAVGINQDQTSTTGDGTSSQDQDATGANLNQDNDDFITTQVDVCAIVDTAIIC